MGYIPRVGPHPESATTETSPSSATTAPPKPTGPDLLIEVVATVVIRDFSKYYPGVPIDDFKPKYFPLADGSLVSPPLIKDLLQVHAVLIISTALFVFFFRNTFTVVRYIRSGQIPHKILFYILLGSQAIGFTFPLPTLISIFTQHVNCRMWVVKSPQTRMLNTEPGSKNRGLIDHDQLPLLFIPRYRHPGSQGISVSGQIQSCAHRLGSSAISKCGTNDNGCDQSGCWEAVSRQVTSDQLIRSRLTHHSCRDVHQKHTNGLRRGYHSVAIWGTFVH